ncbi:MULTISPECIES: hypothetical protein [Calothrix]|uniref:Uncharacterized protein n=2 Tax=Calothrix TaxID=1186 RepID=A0ABR8AC68_9CYAN|nr:MULTISPECIES: hypothetical protein [Calothrix]MBD2196616.1 hypothetical protein [Calothrix parietina FACHB-288]MBD2228019.1 hypothetical protein [Calothrix anomala FACHB-343]
MNETVIVGLNPAKKTKNIYAYLVDELDNLTFTFLYNPEEKSFSKQAKYDEGATALTSTPSQFYSYTSGLTLRLSNLILESYTRGKTCQILLDKLQALMVADPVKGKYAPTPVYFKWGSDKFGPAVITDLSWSETSWLNGEVASARVSFTLLQIPESQLPRKAQVETSQNKLKAALKSSNKLTDRQKEDAASKAKIWLNQNIKKLPEKVSSLVKINKYKIVVQDNGIVALYTNNSKPLGVVGWYKDGKLDTSGSNNNLNSFNK